ncbi:hypothetical protein OAL71_02290 [Phycisphaerales bacterium]|nr:hypothetical protein [Phycisphaerales bacterium]
MFIIAAGLGIVYLIPPSEPTLLADSGASDGSSASESGSESGGDAGTGDSTSGDGEASDGGSGESPTPEAGGGSSAVQDQIEAQREWGVFDAERWKEIQKTLGDNAGLESTNAKSISSAIVVAEKVAERLNGNDPFSPQRWEALKINQEKGIRDLAIEGAFENFLRQVAAARNLEEWNKEIAPAVKSTFGSGDAAPLEAERRNLHSKIEDFVTEKSPNREYGFLTDSGGDSEFWDVGKKGLRGFTCLGWLVAVSPGDEAERQWEFHPLNKAAAVSPSELWFLWEPSNDDESLELRRLSSKFGPDVVDEIYPKDVDSSTRTLLENPEPSIETGDAQLLLVFRPLDWTEVEDVPQMQTLNPDPTQIDSPALETPRSEIPQQFADSAWKNLGPGKDPPSINRTLEKKVKGAVDSWNFAPMIKKPLTAEEKKNGTPPPPLLWEGIDLGDFENQASQSWGTKEATLKGKVEKGLDDPEGWPDLREELALFLKPFVSEGLFLVEPFDAEDADDDRRKEIFETFVEIVQNPESFFKQRKIGPDEFPIDDVLKRAKRWRDVITKRIETLKNWDDLQSRSESLLKDPKLDWLRRLQSRYEKMFTELENQRKRLDKYIEVSHRERGPTSLEKAVDAQIEEVYEAFGMVTVILEGKNIKMGKLWPASRTLMPKEFKGKKLIDALDQLEYSLKVVIDQLEAKKGSVDP